MSKSALELDFSYLLMSSRFPKPTREYRFCPERKWRFDFAWPDKKVACELNGGIWIQGRHSRGKGMLNDMDKTNKAVVMGWKVLTYSSENMGQAVEDLGVLLGNTEG